MIYEKVDSQCNKFTIFMEELTEKALLLPKGIQKVEAGRSGMYVETFIRIASTLDVSLDILADMVRVMFRLKSSYLDRR